MKSSRCLLPALACLALAFASGPALAERVPMTRTPGFKSSGSRQDITVPYLTNGRTAFGAYTVAPAIYSSPIVDDVDHPQARPVFNLIFYGAEPAFGGQSQGAVLRQR